MKKTEGNQKQAGHGTDIFDQKISSEEMCAISAMRHGTPYDVREVMPDVTVKQICQMCKL